jgi:spermidine dehydrogenase
VFERNVHEQLGRMFRPFGFEPHRDIEAITVNRWAHGYAYSYQTLWDGDQPPDQRPNVIGRKRYGRIAIANSDAGATPETQVAIAEAHRAVQELLADT